MKLPYDASHCGQPAGDDNYRSRNIGLTPRSPFHLLLCAFVACAFCLVAHATVLWEANTANGLNVFEGLEQSPGTIAVANDPQGQYGSVYRYNLTDLSTGKERCESRGTKLADGSVFRMQRGGTYYIGWRSLWNPMPTGSWVALFQMHAYGQTGMGAPLVLRNVNADGRLYLQNDLNGTNQHIWDTALRLNVWQSFVIGVHLDSDPTKGWVELWHNGVKQTFNNGQQRFYCATHEDEPNTYNRVKWGVYRSGPVNGNATAYMSRARIGTAFEDVDPNNGTGGGFTGNYRITARHSAKVAVVQSASTANSANVVQWSHTAAAPANDEWQLVSLSDGYYSIINRNSLKAMVVQSASMAAGAAVVQYDFGGANTNDEWLPVSLGGGYYRLVNRHSGHVLQVRGNSTSNGAQFEQAVWTGATHQQFQLISVP